MRFMIDHGKKDDERSRWLAEPHLCPIYQRFAHVMGDIAKADLAHAFYVFAGGSGAIFNALDECKRTTGIDPGSKAAIKRHADYLANLMVPE